jgi:glucose dehydrogenase
VQLIDDQERLVSLVKDVLRDYVVIRESSMPSYKDKLSPQEVADVVAYLLTLKELMTMLRPFARSLFLVALLAAPAGAQVSSARLLGAAEEPQNWLTYSGTYLSQRYSQLGQVTTSNVIDLEMKWVFQAQSLQSFSTTPLVVDGVMYLTQAPNDVVALDAKSGRIFWTYHYAANAGRLCCRGIANRGVAILGDTLFMATVDAHLVAIDAKNGRPLWNTKVADSKENYGMTLAPLVVKDKVLV